MAQSTTEAEYIALVSTSNQAIWLRKLLEDLGHKQSLATELYCDNKLTISIAQNLVHYRRTKHIKIKYHAVKEAVEEALVNVLYCSSEEHVADIMTNVLPKAKLELLKRRLGMTQANLKK